MAVLYFKIFKKLDNDFQLEIYAIVGDVAKFRLQCHKYKMDFYPELTITAIEP